MTNTLSYTAKESAAALRSTLKLTFPGVKFSVRMATGTAHGWVTIRWTDGPVTLTVRQVVSKFQGLYFDSQDDSYRSTGSAHALCGADYIRDASPERIEEAAQRVEYDNDGRMFIRKPDGERWTDRLGGYTPHEFAALYARVN